jgi:DNA-binding transcriptional LysR family regulator
LVLRPSHKRVPGSRLGTIVAEELAEVPFVLYPKRSNMRSIIDQFFGTAGIHPRVIMEADDTEAIKSLVESGYAYSILPGFALRGSNRFFQVLRVAGHALIRRQALAMARTDFPRALTESIALFLQNALTIRNGARSADRLAMPVAPGSSSPAEPSRTVAAPPKRTSERRPA